MVKLLSETYDPNPTTDIHLIFNQMMYDTNLSVTITMTWQYDGDHLSPLLSADQGQPRPQGVAHEAQQ